MIPYDDLVIALQSWRAKQGLPVAQMSASLTPPPMQAQAPQASPAPRAMPPAAPGSGRMGSVGSPALEVSPTHDEALDVDGALIEEAHYESEGDDFAMAFAAERGESTAIGHGPTEHTHDEGGTEVASPAGRGARPPGRTEDW